MFGWAKKLTAFFPSRDSEQEPLTKSDVSPEVSQSPVKEAENPWKSSHVESDLRSSSGTGTNLEDKNPTFAKKLSRFRVHSRERNTLSRSKSRSPEPKSVVTNKDGPNRVCGNGPCRTLGVAYTPCQEQRPRSQTRWYVQPSAEFRKESSSSPERSSTSDQHDASDGHSTPDKYYTPRSCPTPDKASNSELSEVGSKHSMSERLYGEMLKGFDKICVAKVKVCARDTDGVNGNDSLQDRRLGKSELGNRSSGEDEIGVIGDIKSQYDNVKSDVKPSTLSAKDMQERKSSNGNINSRMNQWDKNSHNTRSTKSCIQQHPLETLQYAGGEMRKDSKSQDVKDVFEAKLSDGWEASQCDQLKVNDKKTVNPSCASQVSSANCPTPESRVINSAAATRKPVFSDYDNLSFSNKADISHKKYVYEPHVNEWPVTVSIPQPLKTESVVQDLIPSTTLPPQYSSDSSQSVGDNSSSGIVQPVTPSITDMSTNKISAYQAYLKATSKTKHQLSTHLTHTPSETLNELYSSSVRKVTETSKPKPLSCIPQEVTSQPPALTTWPPYYPSSSSAENSGQSQSFNLKNSSTEILQPSLQSLNDPFGNKVQLPSVTPISPPEDTVQAPFISGSDSAEDHVQSVYLTLSDHPLSTAQPSSLPSNDSCKETHQFPLSTNDTKTAEAHLPLIDVSCPSKCTLKSTCLPSSGLPNGTIQTSSEAENYSHKETAISSPLPAYEPPKEISQSQSLPGNDPPKTEVYSSLQLNDLSKDTSQSPSLPITDSMEKTPQSMSYPLSVLSEDMVKSLSSTLSDLPQGILHSPSRKNDHSNCALQSPPPLSDLIKEAFQLTNNPINGQSKDLRTTDDVRHSSYQALSNEPKEADKLGSPHMSDIKETVQTVNDPYEDAVKSPLPTTDLPREQFQSSSFSINDSCNNLDQSLPPLVCDLLEKTQPSPLSSIPQEATVQSPPLVLTNPPQLTVQPTAPPLISPQEVVIQSPLLILADSPEVVQSIALPNGCVSDTTVDTSFDKDNFPTHDGKPNGTFKDILKTLSHGDDNLIKRQGDDDMIKGQVDDDMIKSQGDVMIKNEDGGDVVKSQDDDDVKLNTDGNILSIPTEQGNVDRESALQVLSHPPERMERSRTPSLTNGTSASPVLFDALRDEAQLNEKISKPSESDRVVFQNSPRSASLSKASSDEQPINKEESSTEGSSDKPEVASVVESVRMEKEANIYSRSRSNKELAAISEVLDHSERCSASVSNSEGNGVDLQDTESAKITPISRLTEMEQTTIENKPNELVFKDTVSILETTLDASSYFEVKESQNCQEDSTKTDDINVITTLDSLPDSLNLSSGRTSVDGNLLPPRVPRRLSRGSAGGSTKDIKSLTQSLTERDSHPVPTADMTNVYSASVSRLDEIDKRTNTADMLEESTKKPSSQEGGGSLPASPLVPRRKKKRSVMPMNDALHIASGTEKSTTEGISRESALDHKAPPRPPLPSQIYNPLLLKSTSKQSLTNVGTTDGTPTSIRPLAAAKEGDLTTSQTSLKIRSIPVPEDNKKDSLNPFDSEDDDDEGELNETPTQKPNKKASLNPFDSEDDDVEDDPKEKNSDRGQKLPPASNNPFDEDEDEIPERRLSHDPVPPSKSGPSVTERRLPPIGYNPFDDDDDEEVDTERRLSCEPHQTNNNSNCRSTVPPNPFDDNEEDEEVRTGNSLHAKDWNRQQSSKARSSSPFQREDSRAFLGDSGRFLTNKKKRQAPLPPGSTPSNSSSTTRTALPDHRQMTLPWGMSSNYKSESSARKKSSISGSTLSLSPARRDSSLSGSTLSLSPARRDSSISGSTLSLSSARRTPPPRPPPPKPKSSHTQI